MADDGRYLRDFHTRVIKGISGLTSGRGYMTGDFPFIPELYLQNSKFIPMAVEEIERTEAMGNELYRHVYVSYFGGIIGTFLWYYARDTLASKGLYEMCRELRPIKELDETAYGLMGMSVADGEYDLKELFYEIYSFVAWELGEARREYGAEVEKKLLGRLDRIIFHVGMWIALAKLGDLVKEK